MERLNKLIELCKGEPEIEYKPRNGDVIIIGSPKSGTTWLQQILHQIRTKGDENFDDINRVIWWITKKKVESFKAPDLNSEQVSKPRVYKCHFEYPLLPKCDEMKYI